eukprot:9121-Chlamydomonas_euryale.AAC.2
MRIDVSTWMDGCMEGCASGMRVWRGYLFFCHTRACHARATCCFPYSELSIRSSKCQLFRACACLPT